MGTAPAASAPPRQSSAINFNAALGKWALPARPNTAGGNLLPPAGTVLSSAASSAARQPHMGTQAQADDRSSVKVTHLLSGTMTYQQDLRPRSSDGILRRITVDRGPATGVLNYWCSCVQFIFSRLCHMSAVTLHCSSCADMLMSAWMLLLVAFHWYMLVAL